MNEGMHVDPDRAIRAGRELHDVGERLARARWVDGGLVARGHAEAPWGDDELGKAFALGPDGEGGYLASAEAVLKAWQAVAERITLLGASVVHAVDRAVEVDDHFGGRIGRLADEVARRPLS